MIGRLEGRLARRGPQSVIIDVGGVGYRVLIPLSTFYALPPEGERASLEISTQVREDAITLFGFASEGERALFELLITVSRVGPRLATNILSGIAVEDLRAAVAAGDVPRLASVPGVGPRTAERLVVELREKIRVEAPAAAAEAAAVVHGAAPSAGKDAVAALVNLGYREKEAERAVARASREGADSLEALIRRGLAILSG